jgi:tetratricopeptide (TPR) repeat protein
MNAIEYFYSLIYTDSTIDNLSLNRDLLAGLGILKEKGQTAAEFQNRLRDVQQQMRLVRRDAGVFLSQCHFDNGNPSAAANWLTRMRDRDDTERWLPTIEYVLGRSVEARREYEEAIKLYKRSSAAQFHGDVVRARLLAQLSKSESSQP